MHILGQHASSQSGITEISRLYDKVFSKYCIRVKSRRSIFCAPTMRLTKTVKPINAVRETATESRSPAGPRRLRECPRPSHQSGKVRRSDTRPGDVRERAERSEGSDSTQSEMRPVSACKPLCAIFLRKPSVYPLSCVKANVDRLYEKLKSGMRNGLEQRCGGNFLAIFAGVSIGKNPNFSGRFFER